MSVSNKTGSNVFLTCEAAGVPLPVVEWVYTLQNGKQIVYPSELGIGLDDWTDVCFLLADDDRISTLVRGGPNAHVLTSWLQIQSLQRNDQGTYTCVASNSLGKVEKSCSVSVESKWTTIDLTFHGLSLSFSRSWALNPPISSRALIYFKRLEKQPYLSISNWSVCSFVNVSFLNCLVTQCVCAAVVS